MGLHSTNLFQFLFQNFRILFERSLPRLVKEQLSGSYSVLDVGCGRCSILAACKNKKTLYKVGLDFYEPYIVKSKLMGIHDQYILADVRQGLPFPSKSFDCVIASEVIEHLTKADGLRMIKELERVAKNKIILTTPNGFLEAFPGPEDNPEEKHISGWVAKELKALGFKVYGFNGFKVIRNLQDRIKNKPKTALNIFIKILIIILSKCNPIVYYFPSLAFHLFCFKNIKNTKFIGY